MGKREAAMAEARFLRGASGVDGRATDEDARDEAEVERDKAQGELLRGRTWLGRELLTWLLWRSDGGGSLVKVGKEGVEALFIGKVVLRGLHGEVTELSAKGTLAPYSEQVRHALDRGLLVHSARVRFTSGERVWEATLDAEHLDVRSAKLPALLTEEEDDRMGERLDLAEQLSAMVDALVESFLRVRVSRAWRAEAIVGMKAWMKGEQSAPDRLVVGAARAKGAAARSR